MLRLLTLGDLRLEGADASHLSSRRKDLLLLAYLARRGGHPLSRAEAAALLWDDADERHSRQSLRQALSELRRLVGDALVVHPDHVALTPGALALDASELEAALEAGRHAEVVELWRGEFLPGAEEVGGEELRSWLEAEREALRRRFRAAAAALAGEAERRGAWREGVEWAERWTAACRWTSRVNASCCASCGSPAARRMPPPGGPHCGRGCQPPASSRMPSWSTSAGCWKAKRSGRAASPPRRSAPGAAPLPRGRAEPSSG